MNTEYQFIKDKIDIFKKENTNKISVETINNKRYYKINNNFYSSVTTMLSEMKDKSGLIAWQDAIGFDNAEKIRLDAAKRGTEMHKMIELHFNDEKDKIDISESGYSYYKKMKIYLNKIIPLGIEVPLWSEKLRLAGTADCIGIYDNKLCIIDFKTSNKEKRPETIIDYFYQATIYSMMLWERLSIATKSLVILISCKDGFPQEFKRNVSDFIPQVIKLVHDYNNNHELVSAGGNCSRL